MLTVPACKTMRLAIITRMARDDDSIHARCRFAGPSRASRSKTKWKSSAACGTGRGVRERKKKMFVSSGRAVANELPSLWRNS